MTDNVIDIGCETTLDLQPDRVIEAAKGEYDQGVVIIGYDADGEFRFCSSIADGGSVLWLMALAQRALLEMTD